MCLRFVCFVFHFSLCFFKGHSLWGSRQESRNVQSSSYSWNYVQVSIFFFSFLFPFSVGVLFFADPGKKKKERKRVVNFLPFNKFWHSWCDAAIQTVLWSFSNYRERDGGSERAAVISNFDMMWFNFDTNMTVKMNCLSQWREIECIINSQWQSTWVHLKKKEMYVSIESLPETICFLLCMLFSPLFST